MSLGKPIRDPEPPKPDVIEQIAPGVISRNGKLETQVPEPGFDPRYSTPVPILTPSQIDALKRALGMQADDGFSLDEFGVM